MGLFTFWKRRKKRDGWRKYIGNYAKVFTTLNRLETSGLISWDQKNRRLFIERSLALLTMRDEISFTNFIQNVYLWHYSRQCDKAWADFFLKEELKAVRIAEKKYASLSRADVDRIRAARRNEILETDMAAPKVEGFEFFIVSPPDLSQEPPAHSQQPIGTLTAVGHYDPDTEKVEMALWKDVEPYINGTK